MSYELWDMETGNMIDWGAKAEVERVRQEVLDVNPQIDPDKLVVLDMSE